MRFGLPNENVINQQTSTAYQFPPRGQATILEINDDINTRMEQSFGEINIYFIAFRSILGVAVQMN